MAETAELDSRIERLEAALTATADALEHSLAKREAAEAAPDHGPELASVKDELQTAQQTIETLEQHLKDREKTLDDALARAKEAEAKLDVTPAAVPEDATDLRAQLDALKAARAQDLAEMKALLAELEPILETADA